MTLDKQDVVFYVYFHNTVFEAIEQFFNIMEMDKKIIVGSCSKNVNQPVPLMRKLLSNLCKLIIDQFIKYKSFSFIRIHLDLCKVDRVDRLLHSTE